MRSSEVECAALVIFGFIANLRDICNRVREIYCNLVLDDAGRFRLQMCVYNIKLHFFSWKCFEIALLRRVRTSRLKTFGPLHEVAILDIVIPGIHFLLPEVELILPSCSRWIKVTERGLNPCSVEFFQQIKMRF